MLLLARWQMKILMPAARKDARGGSVLRWRCGCVAAGSSDLMQIEPCSEHATWLSLVTPREDESVDISSGGVMHPHR